MRRPLLPIAIMLLAGVAAGYWIDASVVVLAFGGAILAAMAVLLLVFLPRFKAGRVALLLAAGVAGLLSVEARQAFVPANDLRNVARARDERAEEYVITGEICDEPAYGEKMDFLEESKSPDDDSNGGRKKNLSFDVSGLEIGNEKRLVPVAGKLRVYVEPRGGVSEEVRRKVEGLLPGTRVRFVGRLSEPSEPTNPGGFDFRRYLAEKGVYATTFVSGAGKIEAEEPSGFSAARLLARTRALFAETFYKNFDRGNAALLSALLLGDRENLPERTVDEFSASGAAHFLSISGLHLVIITSVAYLILVALHVPYRPQRVVLIVLVICYTAMVGSQPPVVRSAVMIVLFLFGQLLGRRGDTLNTLSLAAILIALWNPYDVFSVGFQLSFIAVAGIILFTSKTARALLWGLGWIKARLWGELGGMEFERYAKLRIMEAEGLTRWRNAGYYAFDWVTLGVATSLSAWAATTPLVAYHFGNFSPLLPLTNLLLMALMFAALAIGFLVMVGVAPYALIAGAAPVFLPQWFGSVPLLAGSGVVTHIFARLSWRNVPAFSIFAVLACYAALAMLPLLRKVRIFRVACPALLLVAAGLVGWQFAFGGAKGLEVAILDVGQGSANVVRFPDGRVLIFDCGSVGNGTGRYDVVPYLREAGVTRIDAIIVSHPHGDHFEGLSDIIDRYPVGCVVITRYFDVERYPVWAAVEKKIRERGVEIFVIGEGGRLANFPEARFFLADFDAGDAASNAGGWDALANNMSLAMEIRAEGAAALFTADMEESAIAHFLSARGEGPVDVMTAPHHGQYLDAATDSLLAEVRPRAVVVSSNGSRAKFAGACRANGAEFFETRRGGAVIFEAKGGRVEIRSFRQRGKDG